MVKWWSRLPEQNCEWDHKQCKQLNSLTLVECKNVKKISVKMKPGLELEQKARSYTRKKIITAVKR